MASTAVAARFRTSAAIVDGMIIKEGRLFRTCFKCCGGSTSASHATRLGTCLSFDHEDVSAMGPRLPPELVDRIIDHLPDDQRSLTSCARTRKQFFPARHLHLPFPLPQKIFRDE